MLVAADIGMDAAVLVVRGMAVHVASSCSSVGDCRAVMGRDGQAIRLTRDHKPNLPSEQARIFAAGGEVHHVKGCWRVILATSEGAKKKVRMLATSRCVSVGVLSIGVWSV